MDNANFKNSFKPISAGSNPVMTTNVVQLHSFTEVVGSRCAKVRAFGSSNR